MPSPSPTNAAPQRRESRSSSSFAGNRLAKLLLVIVACWLPLCGLTTSGLAQDNPARPSDGASDNPTKAKTGELLTPEATDVIRLLGEDGKVHTLRVGETLKRVLEMLEKVDRPQNAQADFQITSLVLEGRADLEHDRSELDATLEVQVRSSKPQVRVPLRLTEGTLLGHTYVGNGKLGFEPNDKSTGMICWLSGEGKHVIKLKLAVPLKRAAATQRLQLSLPQTVQSRLSLDVPQSRVTVSRQESQDIVTESIDANRTRITVHGLGNALDLTWQGAREATPTKRELLSRVLMLAEVQPDGVLVLAAQTVRATQGTFSALTVQLPPGFKVDEVADRTGTPLQMTQAGEGRVTVSLSGETNGPVELNWELRGSLAANSTRVELSGLLVADAVRQDGMLGVITPEGFTLRSIDTESKLIERVGAATFRPFVEGTAKRADVSQAFSFEGPFRAVFQLERVAASYLVTPSYALQFNGDSVELDATFGVRVYRGTIDSLTLRWPNSRAEDWQLDVQSEIFVLPEVGPSGDDVLLRFGESLNRLDEPVEIHVRARRNLTKTEKFSLTLPTVLAPRRAVASLTVRNAGNVESSLTATEGTVLRLAGSDSDRPVRSTGDVPENQRPRRYELSSDIAAFTASVTTKTQTVSCTPRTTLMVETDRIRVTQVFEFQVQYERLAQVRLVLPNALAERAEALGAQFALVQSDEDVVWVTEGLPHMHLTPTVVAAGDGVEGRQLRVTFPQPSWGRFRLAVQYSVPINSAASSSESQSVEVPLMTAIEGGATAAQLQLRVPDNVTIKVTDEAWRSEVTLERFPTFAAEGTPRRVGLSVRVSPTQAVEEFTVRRAAIRLRIDQGGAITQALYWINGDVSYLSLGLPKQSVKSAARFWWDGRELEKSQVQAGAEPHQVRLDVSELERDTWHLLAVEYATEGVPQFGLHNFVKLTTPRFATDVWLAESLWEIVLPFDEHLFVYPSGLTPRFHWEQRHGVWSRQPLSDRGAFPEWVLADESELKNERHLALLPASFQSLVAGNSYVFSGFGRQHQIEFQTMSQPSIVLSGAGLALLIAFVLVKIPATRHVLTLLVLGVAMAMVGIWHFEPVQLLLQPAAIGVGLAVMASILEARIKRSQQVAFVTLSSPSELVVPTSASGEKVSVER